jgi:fluoroquinolone transport system permease protein
MLVLFRKCIKADIRFIGHNVWHLTAAFTPILIVIILGPAFSPLSEFVFQISGFRAALYYSIIGITITSFIPFIFGVLYAFILLNDSYLQQSEEVSSGNKELKCMLLIRMVVPALLSLIFILITVYTANPVPSEGWLRKIYVSSLLALQAPLIVLFIGSMSTNKKGSSALSKLYILFLAVVPFGLLVHHPWNYFAFFSPFYWISWAWVIKSPVESLTYGTISLAITICCGSWLLSHFLNRQRG